MRAYDDDQELTEFLGRKFDGNDTRFDGIDARLDGIDVRFEGVDVRFEGIESRLARVEVLGERSQHHIELLAEGLRGLRQEMNQRFEVVDHRMAEGFASMRSEMVEDFGNLDRRLERLEGSSRRP